MFVSMFGEVQWDDPQGMWSFLCAHDLKHQALARILVNAGDSIPAFLLAENIDDYWIQMHHQQHVLLSQVISQSADSSLYNLLTNPMSSEQAFYDWHDIHDLIHQQIDQGLGVSGT